MTPVTSPCGGFCCEAFCIPSRNWSQWAIDQILASTPTNDSERDNKRVAGMLIVLPEKEGGEKGWHRGYTWYTCKHFDKETRLCKDYENRPEMCRLYNSSPQHRCNHEKCLCPASRPPQGEILAKDIKKKLDEVPADGIEPSPSACHADVQSTRRSGREDGGPTGS